ncbi:MAG: hypothetical protein ACSHXY_09960 [Alphaproteobacteria bacterium]
MGRVHKLMISSCLKGIAFGWALLALILFFNVFDLRDIIFTSSDKILAIFLLCVGFAITFGNAAMGHAIMRIPRNKKSKDVV